MIPRRIIDAIDGLRALGVEVEARATWRGGRLREVVLTRLVNTPGTLRADDVGKLLCDVGFAADGERIVWVPS